jgi:serine/threonine protein kinase/Tol biopolymer transport system component
MPLAPGTSLGGYEIRGQLGAGGMGEVYRALDRRLDREVAIKILPPTFTSDPDRLHRFEQEARAAAALNHPNILAIYQFGTSDNGQTYLVTELLEGETLRERLNHGAIALRKAIEYGVQIANGLAAPHEKGIVHRDLKPENLFLTKDGRVKILDFGLAKLGQAKTAAGAGPTLTRMTEPGVVMGTIGYMAPEQVRGETVDARSDIFALGTIVHEMLTGKRTFDRPSSAEIMAAILKEDPAPLAQAVPNAPPGLQRVVNRCLEKNPEQRFQSASDLGFALKELSDTGLTSTSERHAVVGSRSGIRTPLLVAAVVVVFAVAVGAYLATRPPALPTVSNYVQLSRDGQTQGIVGIDGSRLILYGTIGDYTGLEEMSVNGGEPRKLPVLPDQLLPFSLSPDATEVLAVAGTGTPPFGPLWSVPLVGGSPHPLGDYATWTYGAGWSADGKTIAFAKDSDIWLGDRSGSPARKLVSVNGGLPNGPTFSPDGQLIRFSNQARIDSPPQLWEVSAEGNGAHRLLPGFSTDSQYECCGSWTPDGKFYVFEARGQLWVLPTRGFFQHSDPKPVQLTSSPITLGSHVFSADGKKVYVVGATARGQLLRYDARSRTFTPYLGGMSGEFAAFSRDGKWVSYVQFPEGTLWRMRVDGTERLQLINDGSYAMMPQWSPDGQSIYFYESYANRPSRMFQVAASGGVPQPVLPEDSSGQQDPNFSPDGSKLVFGGGSRTASSVIRILDLKTHQLTTVPGSEGLFSPRWCSDGRSIPAMSGDLTRLLVFDLQTQKWRELAKGTFGWLNCSKDGQYVYSLASLATDNALNNFIIRVRIKDGKLEPLHEPRDIVMEGRYGNSLTLAPDDSPLLMRSAGAHDVYSLDFREP